MCNIHALSCIIGSSKPLFSLSRTRYMYGDGSTTVHFLWKMNNIWSLNISYSGVQCNPMKFKCEKETIMDDAVLDKLTEWDVEKLKAINACRLYHGIVYPSDMLHYNRRFINSEFLYGIKSMRTALQQTTWPEQPVPPDPQWAFWRAFIYIENIYCMGRYNTTAICSKQYLYGDEFHLRLRNYMTYI